MVTMQREFLDFRTPQHPSLGTNNWGGASPLLARNIPKESLETKYLRLTRIRTRDEIFLPGDDFRPSKIPTPIPPPAQRRGFLLRWLQREKKDLGGGGGAQKKRSRWLPSGDPRKRWPQDKATETSCLVSLPP